MKGIFKSWIICLGPKCHHMYPYWGDRGRFQAYRGGSRVKTQGKEDRDWSDRVTSQGMLATPEAEGEKEQICPRAC